MQGIFRVVLQASRRAGDHDMESYIVLDLYTGVLVTLRLHAVSIGSDACACR